MKTTFKLGTRASALARTQSQWVADQLMAANPAVAVELVYIKTTGDLNREAPLGSLGGKGVFTREIEQALLDGEIDFAVHSLKDLPTALPPGLILGCTPVRADARDALVGPMPLQRLPAGSVVGTGSLRRQIQLKALRPDVEFRAIRGNVPTRIEKWRKGDYPGGVVLALAGLVRLGALAGAAPEEIHPLDPSECIPAPCQGILGLECRQGDEATVALLQLMQDPVAHWESLAERAFLETLEGGCNLPAAAYARAGAEEISVTAVLQPEGQELRRLSLHGPLADSSRLGREIAESLRQG